MQKAVGSTATRRGPDGIICDLAEVTGQGGKLQQGCRAKARRYGRTVEGGVAPPFRAAPVAFGKRSWEGSPAGGRIEERVT